MEVDFPEAVPVEEEEAPGRIAVEKEVLMYVDKRRSVVDLRFITT